MEQKHTVVPLALVAMLSGVLFHGSFAEQTASSAQTPTPNTPESQAANPAAPTQSDNPDRLDRLDVIGRSVGIDLRTEGLRRTLRRALNTLEQPSQHERVECERAAGDLDAFFELSIRKSARGLERARQAAHQLFQKYSDSKQDLRTRCSPASDSSLRNVREFIDMYFNRDALRIKHPKDERKLLAEDFDQLDKTSLKLHILRREAEQQNTFVHFLIATLPDPIDSFTGWQFDPMLDAIAQAAAADDYVLDRVDFQDPDADETAVTASTLRRRRVHEEQPGVVIFRHHRESDEAGLYLVLLVVHENPAGGVHARALASAIRLVTRWYNPTDDENAQSSVPAVRILGPTFSGSSDSIRRVLLHLRSNRYSVDFRLVSGSATDPTNKLTIESAASEHGRVVFQATVQPDDVLRESLVRQIEQLGSRPVAVLYEENTQYGREMGETLHDDAAPSREDGRPSQDTANGWLTRAKVMFVPFPLNISRLRTTAQPDASGAGDILALPSHFRPLPMDAMTNRADQIPQFSSKTTSSYMELALSRSLQAIRREGVGTIVLLATDPRDKLFLAQQIARDSPGVSIVTAESDAFYVHPDYSSYMKGAIVISSYPLHDAGERFAHASPGQPRDWRQFANGSAEGVYNATLALLDYDEWGTPNRASAPPLLDYGLPGQLRDCGCEPPVWISVVGHNDALAVHATSTDLMTGKTPGYVFRIASCSPAELSINPPTMFSALLIVLTSAVAIFWLYRSRWLPLVVDPESGKYFLVTALSFLSFEAFLVRICWIRFQLEPSASSKAALTAACVTILALADLARRAATPILIRPSQARSGWTSPAVRGAVVAPCIWGLLSLVTVSSSPTSGEPIDSAAFLVRAIDLGSGVSPTLPMLFLVSVFVLWGVVELVRLGYAEAALAKVDEAANVEDWIGLRSLAKRSILWVPNDWKFVVLFASGLTCALVFDPFVMPLVSIEKPWFGIVVSGMSLIAQAMLTLSLIQLGLLWHRSRRLLRRTPTRDLTVAVERRLTCNAAFVAGAAFLMLCSHSLYPFPAHQQLQSLDWTYVLVIFGVTLTVLAQMKRDPIISRVKWPAAGDGTWNGAFVLKLAVVGLVPLVALFAAQFPDLGGVLLHWLQPVEKALP